MNSEELTKQQYNLNEVDPELLAFLDFSKMKKKKGKKADKDHTQDNPNTALPETSSEQDKLQRIATIEMKFDSPPTYTYHDHLLPKFYAQLYSREPPPSKYVSTPLQPNFIFKNRKTIFQNFENFIYKMQDSNIELRKQHMINFMLIELACKGGNITKEGLTFIGLQKRERCINIIKDYLNKYVKCTCNNFNTILQKCSFSRLYFIECKNCTCKKYLE
jgi:translation initiation factor 2 beta subunit (eIF-2beta)/eIF-5